MNLSTHVRIRFTQIANRVLHKSIIFLFLIAAGIFPEKLYPQGSSAKNCYHETVFGKSVVFDRLAIGPSFRGGGDSLVDFLEGTINFQKLSADLKRSDRFYADTAKVKFIISKEGEMSNLKVSVAGKKIFEEEVINTMKKSSCRWLPGNNDGQQMNGWCELEIYYFIDMRASTSMKVSVRTYRHGMSAKSGEQASSASK